MKYVWFALLALVPASLALANPLDGYIGPPLPGHVFPRADMPACKLVSILTKELTALDSDLAVYQSIDPYEALHKKKAPGSILLKQPSIRPEKPVIPELLKAPEPELVKQESLTQQLWKAMKEEAVKHLMQVQDDVELAGFLVKVGHYTAEKAAQKLAAQGAVEAAQVAERTASRLASIDLPSMAGPKVLGVGVFSVLFLAADITWATSISAESELSVYWAHHPDVLFRDIDFGLGADPSGKRLCEFIGPREGAAFDVPFRRKATDIILKLQRTRDNLYYETQDLLIYKKMLEEALAKGTI